jgi:hypothetical protein
MRCARSEVAPTGRECTFGADEIIVSKTGVTRRITHANHVFLRVSGDAEHDALHAKLGEAERLRHEVDRFLLVIRGGAKA